MVLLPIILLFIILGAVILNSSSSRQLEGYFDRVGMAVDDELEAQEKYDEGGREANKHLSQVVLGSRLPLPEGQLVHEQRDQVVVNVGDDVPYEEYFLNYPINKYPINLRSNYAKSG